MSDELTTQQRERIEDFVAALRSGEYAQCGNRLGIERDGVKSYCCEGVAAARYAGDVGYKVEWMGDNSDSKALVLIDADDQENHDYAEDSFWEALALNTHLDNGTSTVFAFIMPEGQEVRDSGAEAMSYMALNDEGFTFPQIADLIEWQYLSCPAAVD